MLARPTLCLVLLSTVLRASAAYTDYGSAAILNRGNNQGGNKPGGGGGHHKPPTPPRPPPTPSRRPKDKDHDRDDDVDISGWLCPQDLYACPIAKTGSLSALPSSLSSWIAQGYECTDTTADLHACGGCSALDASHDCLSIPGARDVACVNSKCEVYSCSRGYVYSRKSNRCVKA